MLEIISICLNVITIGLTIYELFGKKSSNSTYQYVQNNIIQQINPKYDITVSHYPTGNIDNIKLKNARWKSKRITQFAIVLIYLSMAINFVSYIKVNAISTLTDITAIVYFPVRNTMMQLSIILVILCILFILRGWNKQQSAITNFVSMKYFSLKIVADIFATAGLMLVDYSVLEKINANTQNIFYSFTMLGWEFLFFLQLLWIQYTISKLYKIVPSDTTYEAREKQLFTFVPVYIASFLIWGLTIYTKFS